MDKLTSRSTLIGAEGKEVVKNVDSSWGVGYNAQSLPHTAGTCQVTACNTGDALCPDLGLKWGGEPVLREKILEGSHEQTKLILQLETSLLLQFR